MDAEVRELVRARADDRCEYCHPPRSVQRLPFHVEHIVAKQHGGKSGLDNLAWACDRCNAFKGPNLSSIDPQSGHVVNLYHPRSDKWEEHFAIGDGVIQGLSPCGRATVRLLQMNAKRRVELRRELSDDASSG
jgi:5-methylcytosine-specific restriction endonuclease McrA